MNELPVLGSHYEVSSNQAAENRTRWEALLLGLDEKLEGTAGQGSENYIQRHFQRGMLLARDRIRLLLDADSPFLELLSFAGYELPHGSPAASLVAGIGLVSGVKCLITAHIPTINGGAWNEYTVKKQDRISRIAQENGLPLIALVQSAGVFLPRQFHIFHPGGRLFHDLAVRSSLGTSSCAIVFGSSTAGGAYQPALSDYTIFVEKQAQVFLGGPPLVKMATGEVVSAEDLGGAEMHASVSGLGDGLAADEFEAIAKARTWVSTLKHDPIARTLPIKSSEPFYDPEELLGIVSADIRKPFDMHEVVARIVDSSKMEEFKPLYGKNLLTGWARIHGYMVGIIGNVNGVLFSPESKKGAQFIRMCNSTNTPIIFLHNVTGFMVGKSTERGGLIKDGAQFVSAVAVSKVPHIGVICGASYGAGNYAMCGRSYDPRFLFAWPNSRVSVMGPDQLAGVMEQISRSSLSKISEEERAKRTAELRAKVEQESSAYHTSAHLLDDGIIDPRDTRDVLGMCLEVVAETGIVGAEGFRGVSRM
ncbi:hypothetical protein YB2330_003228 [Saitoella coloradoensis]